MAWLELHQSLPTHRKTLLMADALDVKPVQIVGHLTCLWLWALDNAQDGVLRVSPQMIARAAQWEDEAHPFADALLAAGFIDPDGHIHDWDAYAGGLIKNRRKNAERVKAWRERHRTRSVPSIDSAENAHDTRNVRITNAYVTPTETQCYAYDVMEARAREGGPTRAGSLAPPLPPPHPTQEDALSTTVESGAAIRPAPKPAKEKAPAHPALKVARDVLGVRADETQRRAIVEAIGDDDEALALFAACCTQWTMRGYNRRNLAGVLEWVAEGGPPPRERSPNGLAQRNGALSTGKPPSQFSRNLQTIEHFWSQHAPDRDRTENDLRTVHRELPGELSR